MHRVVRIITRMHAHDSHEKGCACPQHVVIARGDRTLTLLPAILPTSILSLHGHQPKYIPSRALGCVSLNPLQQILACLLTVLACLLTLCHSHSLRPRSLPTCLLGCVTSGTHATSTRRCSACSAYPRSGRHCCAQLPGSFRRLLAAGGRSLANAQAIAFLWMERGSSGDGRGV